MEVNFPDDISEITISEADLTPHYYFYYHNFPVSSIILFIHCFHRSNNYILYHKNDTPCKIMDSVKESDETIVLTIARIFIEQASETFFSPCKILSKNIFLNYLQSQYTTYNYKKCCLFVHIYIDDTFFKKGVYSRNTCWVKKE
jgi:hypothetical protein